MARKRLSDLLQEESQKISSPENESVIEVTAEEVVEVVSSTTEESSAEANEQTTSKRTHQTKADLEAAIKQLQEDLEQAQKQARHNEDKLRNQISELQAALSGKEALAERLTKELSDAKQAALQLAEANSKFMEEINTLKQVKEKEIVKQKESIKPITYRKSYRSPEILPPNQPEEKVDNSSQMWLLD